MNELPVNLQNRFNLYLNVLPILDKILLVLVFVIGVVCLAMANIRAAIRISNSVTDQTNISKNKKQNISNSNNKSSIYLPCEEQLIESSIGDDNEMCQIDVKSESNYVLDKEPALVLESDEDDDHTVLEIKCDTSDEQV